MTCQTVGSHPLPPISNPARLVLVQRAPRSGRVASRPQGGTVTASLSLTDQLADELASAVEDGVPLQTAARAAGISDTAVYQWLQVAGTSSWRNGEPIDPVSLERINRFSERIAIARARFEAGRVRNIRSAAEQVNAKTGLRDWRADAWLLNNHPATRATYRQEHQVQVQQSGTVEHVHQLSRQLERLSVDELRALRDGQTPALPDAANSSQSPTSSDE